MRNRLNAWHARIPTSYIVTLVAALSLLWGGIAVSLWREYSLVAQDAVDDTGSFARTFAENILRTVEGVDQTLLFVRENYERLHGSVDLAAWARSRAFLNDLALQISVSDRDGWVKESNLGPIVPGTTVADRDHFLFQLRSTDDVLYISTPVVGRVSKKPSIQFARKLIAPDGSFDGIVVVSLDPDYLSRFYQSIALGNGIVVLANEDGTILARAPARQHVVGTTLADKTKQLVTSGAPSGFLRVRSRIDGVERAFSFRRVDRYKLVVFVGLAMPDVLAPYVRTRALYLAVGTLLSLGIIGVGVLLSRQRRRVLDTSLALATTLENMTQGIMMIDPDGSVPVVNGRAIELLGLPDTLMRGKPSLRAMLDYQRTSNEFGPQSTWEGGLAEVLRLGGLAPLDNLYERVRPNGIVLEVRTKRMANGGAVRTFTDVSERKQTEAALAAARDAAEAGARARSEFLAVMSHEIRTPMNGIIGVAGLLLDMKLEEEARQYVRIMRASGDHLMELINDILDFSKLDAGRVELEETAFDLRAEVGNTADLLLAGAQAKNLTLSVHVADAVPRLVIGDPGRLRQVLINLIGNGIKFTQDGGIAVSVELQSLTDGVARLAVAVSDTGIGIAPDKIGQLFKLFTQLDSSVSRQFGGTGLGLVICRRLVELMGGHIAVDSVVGSGSVFRFVIGLTVAPDAPAEAPVASPISGSASYRVLVAEDNGTNRLVVTRMLQRQSHRVDGVGNGREAVEAVRCFPYDLVLMDMMMPEMDGIAATIAIRAMPGAPGRVPVIGLTANVLSTDEAACRGAGMDGFLTKPVTLERLAHTIALVMAERVG